MKKGALTAYVKREYGSKGFTQGGDIKVSVLKELKKSPSPTTRKRATFALNIRKKKVK
jgi:hypothetical protein